MHLGRLKGLVCLGLAALLVAGCAPAAIPTPTPEPAPTPRPTMTLPAGARRITSLEEIAGTWVGLEADRLYHRFNVDGTCYSSVLLENLNTKPSVESTCRFEGTHFITTDVRVTGLPSCGGKPGTYEVHLLANGNIIFSRVYETCAPRGRSMAMEHERVNQPE